MSVLYINSKGEIVDINSSYETIKDEFKEVGIQIENLTLDEILIKLSTLGLDELRAIEGDNGKVIISELRDTFKYKRLNVLTYYVWEVILNLYNYNFEAIPRECTRWYRDQFTFL